MGNDYANQQELFLNRELSWLEFNRRVLSESMSLNVPLLERLKFAAIYFSNLDEFFMVRIGSLTDQSHLEPNKRDDKTGMTAAEQMDAAFARVAGIAPLAEESYGLIREELRQVGVDLLDCTRLTRTEDAVVAHLFREEVRPLLSPQVVDKHHPFPFLVNQAQYVVAALEHKGEPFRLGIIPTAHLPKYFVFTLDNRKKVVFTADMVCHHASKLFGSQKATERVLLRVTRNADLSPSETMFDYDGDFRGTMEELLKKRRRLAVVRVQTSAPLSDKLRAALCDKLSIKPKRIVAQSIPLDFSFGFSLPDQLGDLAKGLLYAPRTSGQPVDLSAHNAIRTVLERDILLAYPFHSMKPLIDLLYEAADSTTVLSIKISLYRLANHSKIVSALVHAAEKGKEVICILELRARFDEQSNIDYAKVLEDAGCTVLYGLSDYKVHAKLCLITRRVHGRISYITQIGTGNYNEKTAEQYTDLCLITADEAVGQDAADVFAAMCIGEVVTQTRTLWVAPNCYKSHLLACIREEAAVHARTGEGLIRIKANSLNDMDVMEALIAASQAGVPIQLYIRGICCLRPGIPGHTETITIKSVVGRYLEHSRIFVFGRGQREQIYIGSGDLLNRNTMRRVEVFAKVRSAAVRRDVLRIMGAFEADNQKAWRMLPDGQYVRPHTNQEPYDSQDELYHYFAQTKSADVSTQHFVGRLRTWLSRLFAR